MIYYFSISSLQKFRRIWKKKAKFVENRRENIFKEITHKKNNNHKLQTSSLRPDLSLEVD